MKLNYSEEQISDYFNASTEMVKFRLNISGVLIQRNFVTTQVPI
jgi:hypothetical protein